MIPVAKNPVAKIEAKPAGQAAAGAPQNGHVPPVDNNTAEEPNDSPKKLTIFFILGDFADNFERYFANI